MKFKLDENLPARAGEILRSAGHEAITLLDQVPAGASDSVVARLVREEGRVLVTLDVGFADIRAYRPVEFPGIVVLRPRAGNSEKVLLLLSRLLEPLERLPIEGRLWIVDERRIRIRGEAE